MILGIASVLLQSHELGNIRTTLTQHWRQDVTEDEMRGIATKQALKMKPNMGIMEVVVSTVDIEGDSIESHQEDGLGI